jgi:hypothetical protein
MSAVKCLKCGVVLESLYRHDFQMCECDNETFVDGGTDYTRLGGMDMEYIEVLPCCEKCGCRLDDKPTVLFAHEGKGWELCEKCYDRMKGGSK